MKKIERIKVTALLVFLVLCHCNGGNGGSDAVCGNGTCESGEDSTTCPADCPAAPVCGNSVCEAGEDSATCPADCPGTWVCGNGVCETGETEVNCPADCGSYECGNGTYSITIQDSSFLEFSTECSDIKINSASLAMNAIDKLPNSGTVMTEIQVGTEFTAATLTFDASTPSTCQVQVTIGGVTRAVTIPGICS